jgi:hypothetical protein
MKNLELQSCNQRILDMWSEAVVAIRIDVVSGYSQLAEVIFNLCAPLPLGHNHDDVDQEFKRRPHPDISTCLRMIGPMGEEESVIFDQAMRARDAYEGDYVHVFGLVEGPREIAPTCPELLVAPTVISGHHHIMALQNSFHPNTFRSTGQHTKYV